RISPAGHAGRPGTHRHRLGTRRRPPPAAGAARTGPVRSDTADGGHARTPEPARRGRAPGPGLIGLTPPQARYPPAGRLALSTRPATRTVAERLAVARPGTGGGCGDEGGDSEGVVGRGSGRG